MPFGIKRLWRLWENCRLWCDNNRDRRSRKLGHLWPSSSPSSFTQQLTVYPNCGISWTIYKGSQPQAKTPEFSISKLPNTYSCLKTTEPAWAKTSQSIWRMAYGNCVRGIIECCTSSTRTIPMCFSISSERKHRKRRAAKLIKQKLNAMIGLPERGDIVWRLGLTIRTM